MKLAFTIAAAAAAVAITSLSSVTPASAAIICGGPAPTLARVVVPIPPCPIEPNTHKGGSSAAPYVLGCIAGSAIGLITAAFVKGRNANSELTIPEAQQIAFTCGLGAFPIIGSYTGPR